MLKAIELLGFKSFADKTRLVFPPGITVVVGPNGSGKSNIVDAIKWVLGEQSVKSLRGQEMSDVIFNGSGARRPLNAAEITLTLDNSAGLLAIDTPEVHITRRVFRSGEGEYLINRQPCRLRDIRDLLRGTGLGTHSYCVIEQGKVDVLLQSSPHERRVLFEEAAGISRFKAKRIEALRRLERVQQNLLRLSDIVDEVESRLRSLRFQAGKARRYKQYTDRLQELRTYVGQFDWQHFSRRLEQIEQETAELALARDRGTAELEVLEARLLEVDTDSTQLSESIRQCEGQVAAARERIAAGESAIEHERATVRELEEQLERYRRELADSGSRASNLDQQLDSLEQVTADAEAQHVRLARQLAEEERQLTVLIEQLDQERNEHERRRALLVDHLQHAAALDNRIALLKSQAATRLEKRNELQHQLSEFEQQRGQLRSAIEQLRAGEAELSRQAEQYRQAIGAVQAQLDQQRQRWSEVRQQLGDLEQQHSGVRERAAVLQQLEQRQEGVSPATRQLLARSREGHRALRFIYGLVADVLRVPFESAPLVELILGDVAQYLVARRDRELLDYVTKYAPQSGGNVGFVWLDEAPEPAPNRHVDLSEQPGVLARADRLVRCDAPYAALANRLLGRTWVVKDPEIAAELSERFPGVQFVTLSRELFGPGILLVGSRQKSIGLISRRSELHAIEAAMQELEGSIEQRRRQLTDLDARINTLQEQLRSLTQLSQQAADACGEHRRKLSAALERESQLEQQSEALRRQLEALSQQHEAEHTALGEADSALRQLRAAIGQVQGQLAELGRRREKLEQQRQQHFGRATELKVELAKSEERLENLRARLRQLSETQQERRRAVSQLQEQLQRCHQRLAHSQQRILAGESEIAGWYLQKEELSRQVADLAARRQSIQAQRAALNEQIQSTRSQIHQTEEAIHARQLAAQELRVERQALADRLREDYGIDIAQAGTCAVQPSGLEQPEVDRPAIQEEIDQLRRKLNNLGNVNLAALEELEELEDRHGALASQYHDLNQAKNSLERIIHRIDAESKRLFAETLQTVRVHFAALFRSLFGGGHADIVLENEADELESGIEIVARPPGKEPRSISLLSGGEKTLTCVALLLAIFRSRPSPFCVLDEVDAALDEANIDRFIRVLQDFLSSTQFILVTHSKKTMTCANTIYGVTMQESGVSKQVSVRFEDVSEDGEILLPPSSGVAQQAPHSDESGETQAA